VAVPGKAFFKGLMLAAGAAQALQFGELADEILSQPFPDLGAHVIVWSSRERLIPIIGDLR
jgi:hypothetical protein